MPRDLSPAAPPTRLRRFGAGIAHRGFVVAGAYLAGRAVSAIAGRPRLVPQLVEELRAIPDRLRQYGDQLGEITASVTGTYRGLTQLPGGPPADAVRIVWLSDVHNNPTAFAVAKALAEQYPGCVVVDTGDIGDWGKAFEARMYAGIGEIPAPYVFIKGNHDGPQTLVALGKIANVAILEDAMTYRHEGLTFAGDSDPRFTPDKSTGDDHFGKERLTKVGQMLAAKLASIKPDVVLVHDPVVAAQLSGTAPLVLCGHTHRRNAKKVGETLILTQGSSGGLGLRGVRQDPPRPLTISVLHIDRTTKRLHSMDELTFGGLGARTLSLVRRSADELGRPQTSLEKA